MRYITPEYQKILNKLPPKEREEATGVLKDVEKAGNASAFAFWCRNTSEQLKSSLKHNWKFWLKKFYVSTVCLALVFFLHDGRAIVRGGHIWNKWLAEYYYYHMYGSGFFGTIFKTALDAVWFTIYFYLLAWIFTGILYFVSVLFRGKEEIWNRRRNVLFAYLDKRDFEAKVYNPDFWFAPREAAAMKEFADRNPNYRAHRGRAWANQI